jgi:hypothetical protein
MATILDLYKNATKNKVENEIYGKDSIRIESRGILNPARQVALLASSPNAIADLIGGQVAGLLGGNAKRPDDTIFTGKEPFKKPVTVAGGFALRDSKIRDAIEEGNEYYVKTTPSPPPFTQRIKLGASNPLQAAANVAANGLRNPLATKNATKGLRDKLKNAKQESATYGPGLAYDEDGKFRKEKKKFSDYFPIYTKVNGTSEYELTGLEERKKKPNEMSWDTINDRIIKNEATSSTFDSNNITRVEITKYGTAKTVYLPGTISGLSEDFSPEWNNFKYVGSPFNVYRYTGVERSIKFNLKLYYTDTVSKSTMIDNLNFLRTLVHPFEKLSEITYGSEGNIQTSALAFSPNFVNFSIAGLYTNLFGFVDELGISIDDNTSWATLDENMTNGMVNNRDVRRAVTTLIRTFTGTDPSFDNNAYMAIGENNINLKQAPYPTVFEVSLGFKIIPNIKIDKNTYVYDFNKGTVNGLENTSTNTPKT